MRDFRSGAAECVATAREVIEIEAEAVALAARRVDEEFVRAVQLIIKHKGKVVVTGDGRLEGVITDGDLRRALERHDDIRNLTAGDIMTPQPVTTRPEATLREALYLMEDRRSQIAVLPVLESDSGRCLGLIRLHDICQAGRPGNDRP